MILYASSLNPADCFGCKACAQICHRNAITFHADAEGFEYPVIDYTRCNACGLCSKVCPITTSQHENCEQQKCYAAKALNLATARKSSSGGVFSVLAEHILAKNGVVFGAAYQQDWGVKHEPAFDQNGLQRLRVSKYVQSDIGSTFRQAKEYLNKGVEVYFSGTPCQIAGLKSYLRRDYTNLLTSDIVCHGTPSPKIWFEYIMHISAGHPISAVSMRKTDGWEYIMHISAGHPISAVSMRKTDGWDILFSFQRRNARKIRQGPHNNPYLHAFLHDLLCRPACYTCPFACSARTGDITLGDYWGVEEFHPNIDCQSGVSLILTNSAIGERTLQEVFNKLILAESRIEWAQKANGNLTHPSPKPAARETINLDLNRLGFPYVLTHYMQPPNRHVRSLYYYIKEVLRPLLRLVKRTIFTR